MRTSCSPSGAPAGLPDGGAAYLDETGQPVAERGVQTWITARTVHSYSLGRLLGVPGSTPVLEAALAAFQPGGVLRDDVNGGWFHAVDAAGTPDREAGKSCYDHAFVLLAASSAVLAGVPSADALLDEATTVFLEKFWDEEQGRPVDTWDVTFSRLDSYRGLNSTMHSVEAMLSVAGAVEAEHAEQWVTRAVRACRFVADLAATHGGRLPEHFGADWVPDLDLNKDTPDDPFKPFGATPGHGLEWARLLLHAEAATGTRDPDLLAAAVALFDRAVSDAWAVDGADGFVYTTDWDGTPVVRQRMHWVAAEAVNAAAALYQRTGEHRYAQWYTTWWDYIAKHLLDEVNGSWHHELDPVNVPTGTVWPGKPDLYHALQTTLVPRLPLSPMVAAALAGGHPHSTETK